MKSNINKFLALLNVANAVTVDNSPMLIGITAEELTGDPTNEVVCFTWTDGEHNYMDILTEGGITNGVFDSNGKFVSENREGEETIIRFYAVELMTDISGKSAAAQFFQELLDSVETLSEIAEAYGSQTLVDLMYLSHAILSGSFIDYYPDESKVLDIASGLPSGEQWSKFIQTGYIALI